MRSFRKKSFICVCMGVVTAIALCTVLQIDTEKDLNGITDDVKIPNYSFKSIWDGEYQAEIDDWYNNNFPLRPWFVRLNNQLLYMIGADINNDIIVGKEGWLYTKEYTECSLYEIDEAKKEEYADYAEKVKLLKEKVESLGKQFIYIITPSKVELYPEYLPARYNYLVEKRSIIENNYDYLKEQLVLAGIPFIDMTQNLKEKNTDIPFFSKTGIHWNYYAAAMCANEVVKTVDDQVNMQIQVEPMEIPYGTEQDVYLLSNIINGIKDNVYYAVEIQYSNLSNIKRKNVVEMGTSFSTELESEFSNQGQCIWNQYTRYQYFTQRKVTRGEQSYQEFGDFYNEQLKSDIANADIIIIENNNSYVPESHYQFVDYLLNMSEEEMVQREHINLDQEEFEIDFANNGNAEDYIRSGFYIGEETGRWAREKAEISINLYSSSDLVLDLSNNTFADDTTILFNDTVVWKTEYGNEALRNIKIPVNILYNGMTNYITILTNQEIKTPKQMGISEDERVLAHWFNKILIHTEGGGK